LNSRPDLTQEIGFYLESFFFLSGFRSYGMAGPLPISLPDISEYARLIGYTLSEDILFFIEVMNSCDHVYLSKAANDQKAEQAAAAKKPASRPPPPRRR